MGEKSSSAPQQQTNRPDGRTGGGTLRPLAAEVSCLSRADGSSKFSSGPTQILAAVYGPAAPRIQARERPTEATIAVVFKHGAKSGLGHGYGATEREIERFICDAVCACVALEEYPRTVIEIVVQIIKADGSVVGTALNAAVLALMDAGVLMNSLPIATTFVVESSCLQNLRLDPSAEEEFNEDYSSIVLVTDSVRQGIIVSMTSGAFKLESFLACAEGASRASKAVLAFMRIAIEQKVTREAQTLWSI